MDEKQTPRSITPDPEAGTTTKLTRRDALKQVAAAAFTGAAASFGLAGASSSLAGEGKSSSFPGGARTGITPAPGRESSAYLSSSEQAVRDRAYAMPITNPAYPRPPIRFLDRELVLIEYRTDPDALRRIVPAPLEPAGDRLLYEWIRMPDSSGLGSYMESGQVIPVTYQGEAGSYTHSMYLDNLPGILAGRELLGFPKVWGTPRLELRDETLVGTLDVGGVRVATGTMGFKHSELDADAASAGFKTPNFLLKSIPHVDGTPRILELVRFFATDVVLKGAWSGPASLELHPHAMAPVAQLPVLDVISATHLLVDMSLTYGEVAHDYLS